MDLQTAHDIGEVAYGRVAPLPTWLSLGTRCPPNRDPKPADRASPEKGRPAGRDGRADRVIARRERGIRRGR